MSIVRIGPAIGFLAQLAVLAALAWTVGLSGPGWVVGVAWGLTTGAALTRNLIRRGAAGLGPADRVTVSRAVLVGAVSALVASSFSRPVALTTLTAVTILALALDAVDGWVARRTETASPLGARFDMEVDAFLILVLSVYVARSMGGWVLVIGAARYAFLLAGRLLPWLRRPLPPRYWRKVVAAIQGVVLTIAMLDVLPRLATGIALAGALVLLVESFGRDVWWLWRRRRAAPVTVGGASTAPSAEDAAPLTAPSAGYPAPLTAPSAAAAAPSGRSGIVAHLVPPAITVLAFLLVWFALVAPNDISRLQIAALVRIPVEGLVILALAALLPPRAARIMAVLVGAVLGLLTILKLLDMGFLSMLDRPFNPVSDWSYLPSAIGVLGDSIGKFGAKISVAATALLVAAVLLCMPLALGRLTRLAGRHRSASIRAVVAFGVVWILAATFGLRIVPGAPIASAEAAGLAVDQAGQVVAGIRDQRAFAAALTDDPYGATPSADLLTGLRGKDVLLVFVESYGRVAVQNSSFSPGVDAVLDAGTDRLRAAGFAARSAFLTSPTFGGISWLAHSTLQSGLWIDSQQRYNQLVTSQRFTLSDAFRRAGWRTVADVPSNLEKWPEGSSFYHYDQIYNSGNVGYRGPAFSYATMPDQYILSAFQRLELSKVHRPPVMAEIDLVSSHTPWAPLPHLTDWSQVGDGSVFDGMPAEGASPQTVWRESDQVRAAYGQSIEYSLSTLISFVQTYGNNNLVLVVVGDHQPATIVSGHGASHDVPITIIAHDPAVLARISGWGWQDGLRPDEQAPVWPMDSFRNRFLTAFGP